MPTRLIKEGILNSAAINSLSMRGEILYRRLMSAVDDYGRTDGRIDIVRARLFALQLGQWSAKQVEEAVEECVSTRRNDGSPLILKYISGGSVYLEITKFGQRVRGESKFPDPPADAMTAECGGVRRSAAECGPTRARGRSESEAEAEAYAEAEAESDTSSIDDDRVFSMWYETYPRKVSRPAGRKAFEAVILKGRLPNGATASDMDGLKDSSERFERLMATSAAWKRELECRDGDKRPHPATFLNSLNWITAPETAAANPKAPALSATAQREMRGHAAIESFLADAKRREREQQQQPLLIVSG